MFNKILFSSPLIFTLLMNLGCNGGGGNITGTDDDDADSDDDDDNDDDNNDNDNDDNNDNDDDSGGDSDGDSDSDSDGDSDSDSDSDSDGDSDSDSDGDSDSDPDGIVLVDKNCTDGEYLLNPKEQFLEPGEFPSIADLIGSYSSSNYMSFIYGVLERRYPTGKSIIEQGGGQQAVDQWLFWKDSAAQVLGSLGTVVHEIGHGIDEQSPQNWYFIAVDGDGNPLSFTTPGMHGEQTTSSSPMYSLERSWLLDDDLNYKRPPAQSSEIYTSQEFGEGEWGCDETYAETYLCGDPEDGAFDSGDQGYNSLIEEFTQYVNSLALAYYLQDTSRASSDRHAMLNWAWWNERYLRKIRSEHPEQYAYLLENEEWLELILTLWGRAWLYLSTDLPGMQPDSGQLHHLVQEPIALEEIQRLRAALGCDNPQELLPEFVE